MAGTQRCRERGGGARPRGAGARHVTRPPAAPVAGSPVIARNQGHTQAVGRAPRSAEGQARRGADGLVGERGRRARAVAPRLGPRAVALARIGRGWAGLDGAGEGGRGTLIQAPTSRPCPASSTVVDGRPTSNHMVCGRTTGMLACMYRCVCTRVKG